MKLDWKKETRRVVEEHIARGEPMSFVLPVAEATKCGNCEQIIKSKKECLQELETSGAITAFCDDLCFYTWWNRKDYDKN